MLFISPAEIRFIRLMGGTVIVLDHIHAPYGNKFPLAVVVSLGRILKREHVKREVRVGKHFIDFGVEHKSFKRGIEIDGRNFHQDVLKELERDEYVGEYGWRLLHIQAADLYRNPNFVQRRVLEFLSK